MKFGALPQGYTCHTCGQFHERVPFSYGPDAPALWHSLSDEERVDSTVTMLNDDLCVIQQQHFFVRGCIELSVLDADEPFVWLMWVSLSEPSFLRMLELWEAPGREREQPVFGWLSNRIPLYPDTLNLKTMVYTRPVGERPFIA